MFYTEGEDKEMYKTINYKITRLSQDKINNIKILITFLLTAHSSGGGHGCSFRLGGDSGLEGGAWQSGRQCRDAVDIITS